MQVLIIPDSQASNYLHGENESVKIGLLIADNKSLEARQGAEMAISIANKSGGFNGLPFQVEVRSMEGPWGTGSNEAVNLIFEEKVWAILGSHDSRNAHLVEQVTTKVRIVFLSSWATDPTLSQAFVPWYFSCVPNDNQQAEALIEEIYNKVNMNKIGAIADDSYDSKLALKSFVKKAIAAGKPYPLQFFYNSFTDDFNNLLDQIIKSEVDCIVLFGHKASSKKIIQQMRQKNMNQPVFGTLNVSGENELSDQELKSFGNVALVTSGHRFLSESNPFIENYQRTYGVIPGPAAAFAYDGMNLIIEAIKEAGLDRDKIQEYLLTMNYAGVTGIIKFDEKGNRLGKVRLMWIKNGLSVPYKLE